jgi:hypothetical protein
MRTSFALTVLLAALCLIGGCSRGTQTARVYTYSAGQNGNIAASDSVGAALASHRQTRAASVNAD